MSRTKNSILALCIAWAAFCTSVTRADDAPDKTYSIKLFRPLHVGQKYQLTASGSEKVRTEILSGGKSTLSEHDMAVHLQGVVTVLAVDSKGRATKESCTVSKFVRTDGKEPAEILPAGTVVEALSVEKTTAEMGHETKYTLKTGAPSEDQKTALGLVFEAMSAEGATDDEIMGTDVPQKVGASWPIHSAKAAADFEKSGIFVDAQDLKGQSTLGGVTSVGDQTFLEVKSEITAKQVKARPGSKLKIEAGTLNAKVSELVPKDPASLQSAMVADATMMMRAKATGPDGSNADVHTIAVLHREVEVKPAE